MDPNASSKKYQRKLWMNSYGTCDTDGHWKGIWIQNSDPGPFAINLIQPTHAKKPTTLHGLHNTLLYIRFRINYYWLSSGFGEQQHREMEAALIDAIIKLQQIATTPPTKLTSATKIPIIRKDCFQVKSNLLTDFRFTTHMNIMILN
jgi:hypothetical protein